MYMYSSVGSMLRVCLFPGLVFFRMAWASRRACCGGELSLKWEAEVPGCALREINGSLENCLLVAILMSLMAGACRAGFCLN